MLREGGIYHYRSVRWRCAYVTEGLAKLVALDRIEGKRPRPAFVSSNSELKEVKQNRKKEKSGQ